MQEQNAGNHCGGEREDAPSAFPMPRWCCGPQQLGHPLTSYRLDDKAALSRAIASIKAASHETWKRGKSRE